jgi:hypothetical protein
MLRHQKRPQLHMFFSLSFPTWFGLSIKFLSSIHTPVMPFWCIFVSSIAIASVFDKLCTVLYCTLL